MSTEDEIAGVIFTFLQEKTQPCYASEICEGVRGLSTKKEVVVRLLQTMCETDIVRHIRGKYILTENMTSEIEENCGGPTYGTTCSTNQGTGVRRTAVAPSEAGAMVPVQQTLYQKSSSSDSTCSTSDLKLNKEKFTKILDQFKDSPGPIKAKDIAQRTGIGNAKASVNRYLHFLKQKNVLQDNGRAEWTFTGKIRVSDDDIQVFAAQLAKQPPGKSKGNPQPPGSSNSICECRNAGPGCHHITNSFHQNNNYHYYNIQVGEHNKMMTDQPPDGVPHGGEHH